MRKMIITSGRGQQEIAEEIIKMPPGSNTLVGIKNGDDQVYPFVVDWIPYDVIKEIRFDGYNEIKVVHDEYDGRTEEIYHNVILIGDIQQWCQSHNIKFIFK